MSTNEAVEAVLTLHESLRNAMLDNDPEPMRAHVAEDYAGSDASGMLHDRALMLTLYGPDGIKLSDFTSREVEAKAWPGTVLLSGKARIAGSYGEHTFEHDLRFLDVYAERGAGWKLVASHVTDLVDNPAAEEIKKEFS